jgi:hypothetical protein
VGGSNVTNYTYTTAQIHKGGKGFLGFQSVSSSNYNSGVDIQANYGFYPPAYLLTPEAEITTLATIPQSEATHTYNLVSLSHSRYAFQKASDYTNYDQTHSYLSVQYTYDAYSNVTDASTDINGIQSSDVSVPTYVSSGNTSAPSKPSVITTTKTRGGSTYTNVLTNTYGPNGHISNMYNITGGECGVNTQMSYDGFGNVLSRVTTPSVGPVRAESYLYEPSGRFIKQTTNA